MVSGLRSWSVLLSGALAFAALVHFALQALAGAVQCQAWGTCPW